MDSLPVPVRTAYDLRAEARNSADFRPEHPRGPDSPYALGAIPMSAMAVLFILFLIVLAAFLGDHFSRLQKMGWAPQAEEYKAGRSLADPIGSALGEIGRADAPYKLAAAAFGPIGTVTGMVYAPIGAGLNAVGKASEIVYKPIGMVLSLIAGAGRG